MNSRMMLLAGFTYDTRIAVTNSMTSRLQCYWRLAEPVDPLIAE